MSNNVLNEIEEYIQNNDIDNAFSLILTNEKEYERNADFMNLKGVFCFNTGEIDIAISCFASAVELDRSHTDARENLKGARSYLLGHDEDLSSLNDEEFLINVVNTIDSMVLKLESCILGIIDGNINGCSPILRNVQQVMRVYYGEITRLKKIVDSPFMTNVYENILDCIEDCFEDYTKNNGANFAILVEFTLYSLLKELREEIYFFGLIYPKSDKMDDYYNEEFAVANSNQYAKMAMETEEYKYPVSIVVPAYNKLEYTKQCVESILKYTQEIDYELILINNGSTDGTKEYFESINYKNKKVLSFNKNIGPIIVYLVGIRAVQGRVLAFVSNDVIVTEKWLKNLLICLESDKQIGIVVPTTNIISNNQAIDVPYKKIDDMQDFAKKYNESDSKKWLERERICPFVHVLPMTIYGKGICHDRLYKYAEFSDDDISLQLRLNGYKVILAKDTFCHHFGSLTLGDAQRENNSLKISREIFKKKYRLDPWNDIQYNTLSLLANIQFNEIKPINVLCIDPGFGMIPYRIKNDYKKNGNFNVTLYNFSADNRFFDVSNKIFKNFNSGESTTELLNAYRGKTFDYILFCKPFEEYDDGDMLLIKSKELLSVNGEIRFLVSNPYSANHIVSLISLDNNIFSDQVFRKYASFVAIEKILSDGGYTKINKIGIPSIRNQSAVDAVKEMASCLNIETEGIHDVLYESDELLFVVKV